MHFGIVFVYLYDFGIAYLQILFFHARVSAKHFVKSYAGSVGNELGRGVDYIQRHVVYSRHVLDGSLCFHSAKRKYLTYLFLAVFAYDVIYYLASPVHTKVDVEVGRRHSLRIEKSFEEQLVFQRIEIGDAYRIRYYRADAAASSRSDGYVLRTRIVDKVPHYQIILGKTRADNYAQLVLGALSYLIGYRMISALQSLIGKLAQILLRLGAVVWFIRRIKVFFLYLDVALFHYLNSIGHSLRTPTEYLHHLFIAFEIKLVVAHLHTRGVVDSLACVYPDKYVLRNVVQLLFHLYAHQNVLHFGVLAFQIMHVVGRHKLYSYLIGKAHQVATYRPLFRQAVILKLYVKVALVKHRFQSKRILFRALVISRREQSRYLSRKTG